MTAHLCSKKKHNAVVIVAAFYMKYTDSGYDWISKE